MSQYLNLLSEQQNSELEYICEEKSITGEKRHYLQGPMMMAGSPNKNHRIYNLDEMVSEVARYDRDYIKQNRAVGELDHPQNSTNVNPVNACHMVVEMHRDGNMFYGKTKILSTPSGKIVENLLADGVRLGISSRALGKLVPQGENNLVENFHLICLDLVMEPSAPAMLESVMESKQYVLDSSGRIIEAAFEQFEKDTNKLPPPGKERDQFVMERFAKLFKTISGRVSE